MLLTFLSVLILQISNVVAQSKPIEGDKILGLFWSPKKDAKIEIYKKGNSYYGKSIWVESPRKDYLNPNVALRKRNILI